MKRFMRISLSIFSFCAFLFASVAFSYPHPGIQPSQIPLDNFTIDQLQQAATAGDPDAQYALGYLYYYGKRVPQNTETALDWMRRAAVQGQTQAIHALQLLGQPVHNVRVDIADDSTDDSSPPPKANTATKKPTANANKSSDSVNVSQKSTKSSMTTAVATPKAEKSKNPDVASKTQYTIQLMASASKATLEQYSKAHQLGSKAHYGVTQRQGKKWYVLTYGVYPSKAAAQQAINTLPAGVKAKHPWVKAM